MKKEFFLLLFSLFCISNVFALDHVVSRGETLESIAAKYGISREQLIEANPDIDLTEYFYIGMKINIPTKSVADQKSKNTKGQKATDRKQKEQEAQRKDNSKESKSNNFEENNIRTQKNIANQKFPYISSKGIITTSILFGSDFSDLVGSFYGIQGQYFRPSGWGATINLNFSYGFEEYGDFIFKIGPSYLYPINKLLYVEGTLAYTATVADTEYNSGTVSGISLIPTVGIAYKKWLLGVNGELYWRNGGSVGGGFFINLGYAF